MEDLRRLVEEGDGRPLPPPRPPPPPQGRLLQRDGGGGALRRPLMHAALRDAPIPPPAPAPAPGPGGGGGGGGGHHSGEDAGGEEYTEDDGEGVGYVSWHDMVAHRRREEVARLLGLDRQLRDWAVAGRPDMAEALAPPPPSPPGAPGLSLVAKCFLCSQGVRSKDAGDRGTHLFNDLLRMLAQLMDRDDYWLTDFTTRFYVERFLPLFRKAGVTAPPFYPGAIYEHFSTTLHTLNPVQFLRIGIRELGQEMDVLKSGHRERRNGRATDDARVAAEVTKKRKLQLEFYSMKPAQMAFYDSQIDGDWAPSQTSSLVPAAATVQALDGGAISPASFAWMRDYLARTEVVAAATATH